MVVVGRQAELRMLLVRGLVVGADTERRIPVEQEARVGVGEVGRRRGEKGDRRRRAGAFLQNEEGNMLGARG